MSEMSTAPTTAITPEDELPGKDFTEHAVTIGGRELRYWEAGTGQTVMVVHGSTGPEPSIGKDLLAADHHVVELELPGFGNAPDDDVLASYADLAGLVAEAVTALGIESYHLIGSSIGGITALHLAVADPSRLLSLSLESPMCFLGDAFARPSDEMWAFLRAFAEDPTAPAPPIPPSPRKPWETQDVLRDQFRRRLRVVQQDRYYVESLDEQLADAAQKITVPAVVIYGAWDPFIVPGSRSIVEENYRRALPSASFVVIEGAGHDLQGEAPEAFADTVRTVTDRTP